MLFCVCVCVHASSHNRGKWCWLSSSRYRTPSNLYRTPPKLTTKWKGSKREQCVSVSRRKGESMFERQMNTGRQRKQRGWVMEWVYGEGETQSLLFVISLVCAGNSSAETSKNKAYKKRREDVHMQAAHWRAMAISTRASQRSAWRHGYKNIICFSHLSLIRIDKDKALSGRSVSWGLFLYWTEELTNFLIVKLF